MGFPVGDVSVLLMLLMLLTLLTRRHVFDTSSLVSSFVLGDLPLPAGG